MSTSSPDAKTLASRKALEGFIGLLEKGDVRGAFEQYTTETYTQHMTGVAPGREGAIAYVQDELVRGGTPTLFGFVAEGNMVGIHMRQTFADGSPERDVIELWRVENGRLAEHWGATQVVSTDGESGPAE
jgi:predicted SnoaL-like aldol condensation-catalyzing enzyme